jgi:hypothetical protein
MEKEKEEEREKKLDGFYGGCGSPPSPSALLPSPMLSVDVMVSHCILSVGAKVVVMVA